MRRIAKRIGLFAAALSTAILLTSCTNSTSIKSLDNTGERISWPTAPSIPRIEYRDSFSKPADLKISRGIFGILRDIAIGEEDTSMILPMATAINRYKQLFVADPGKKGVHRFDLKRGSYRLVTRHGGKSFSSPVSLAVDKDGNVYVVDSDLAKVFIININADFALPLPLDEDFVRPTGIAIDRKSGWIYIVDTGMHAVYVFNSDNSLIRKFGKRGTGDGEFNYPTYIWMNSDEKILVTDSLNFRIQIFDRYGEYLGKFGNAGNGTGDLARPKGVAEDSHRHVYVTDSLFQNVQVFDESGNLLLNFGEQGKGPGQFWLPAGISITDDNTIYVADSYNKRVQIFKYIDTVQ